MNSPAASLVICITFATTLFGCTQPMVIVPKLDSDPASPVARDVTLYEYSSPPVGSRVTGERMQASYCQKSPWDRPATRTDGTSQLRALAKARGANAVGNIQCHGTADADVPRGCWTTVICSGEAFIVPALKS